MWNSLVQHTFFHISLHANVHFGESLAWFKASCLCYTINTGFSQELLQVILLFPCDLEIPQLWICRTAIHRQGRCWKGSTENPGSGPAWQPSWSARQLSCTNTTRAHTLQHCSSQLIQCLSQQKVRVAFLLLCPRASLPNPKPPMPPLLCCPSKGLLSEVLQLVMNMVKKPK